MRCTVQHDRSFPTFYTVEGAVVMPDQDNAATSTRDGDGVPCPTRSGARTSEAQHPDATTRWRCRSQSRQRPTSFPTFSETSTHGASCLAGQTRHAMGPRRIMTCESLTSPTTHVDEIDRHQRADHPTIAYVCIYQCYRASGSLVTRSHSYVMIREQGKRGVPSCTPNREETAHDGLGISRTLWTLLHPATDGPWL